jgi:hypothetical protein
LKEYLLKLSGLTLPTIATVLQYKPKSRFLATNLPCQPGNSNILDLRLLSGHLGDEKANSPSLEKILKMYQDCGGYIDSILLIGGHGIGKTKTIFDVAQHYYTILLDASNNDLQQMSNEIATIVAAKDKVILVCIEKFRLTFGI